MKNLLAIHSEAVEKIVTLPRTTRHVGELLSTEVSEDRKRRASLLQILRALRYLARQGLSIRGSSLTNEIEGKISHCFVHLIVIFHYGWTRKPINTWVLTFRTSFFGWRLTEFIGRLHQEFICTITVDETTDISTQEQCVIVLRWVDDDQGPHEDFIGLHSTP